MATSGSKSVKVTDWDTLKFSWSQKSQSVPNNTTTISWKLELIATEYGYISSSASKAWSVTVNGTKYSGTTTVGINNNSTKTLASGTTTIKHNDNGSKSFDYSFSQVFDITFNSWIGTISGSGSGTLDTIPRKSTLNVSNGTLEVEQTLTITEQASGFAHKVYAESGSSGKQYILGSSSATSTTLNFKWTPPASLALQNTTGTSVSVKFTLETYSGSTLIGSNSYTKSFTIPNTAKFRPSCSITLEDTTGWDDTYGDPVQGLSKIKITVNPTLAYNSPIASYSITADGIKSTASSFTTGLLKTAGDSPVTVTIKDKRGRTATASVTMNVLAYSSPNITALTVHRVDANNNEDDQGEYIRVQFSSRVTALNNKNTAAYTLRYKQSTVTGYTSIELSGFEDDYVLNAATYRIVADVDHSYDVEVSVKDNHGTYARSTSASTAFTLMNWGEDGRSMGIGKVAEKPGYLEVGLGMEVEKPIELAGAEQKLTISTSFKLYNGETYNQPTVRKSAAGMVELVGRLSPAGLYNDLAATAGVLMFNIPTGYRPAVSFTTIQHGSGTAIWLMTVETNGDVKASRYRTGDTSEVPSTSAWMPFHAVYFTNQ